jgi:LuxR family maltose regulon positive regulatory protein
MNDMQFQLKTAPPRPGRTAPARKRLEHRWLEINDRTAIIVTAPQGFGKTTLLAQWRRNWLERGAFVAWASLDAQDDRARFVALLLFALRTATGRDSFALASTQNNLQANRELDALTMLLAEVAQLATPTVVILDDAHRMPQATMRELLAYLLNNAPPNLQFLIGTRRPLELQLTDLLAAGRMATLDARDLRFGMDESLEILRARFGARISLDDAVRLHDLTEGWPLGLQLAATTIERAPDMHEMIGRLNSRRGDIHRFFFEAMLSRLPEAEAAFWIRVSILEVLDVDLCAAVTGDPAGATYIEQIVQTSPVIIAGEGRGWVRLHAMARDFLLGQFDKLPAEERRACHERAAAWYAQRGQLQDAARHALAAGDDALAVQYAARCLRDIAREGRLAEARDWVRRLPAQALSGDVPLQVNVAWLTALGESAADVPAMIAQISRHPQFDEQCRFEAALALSAAAVFLDQPGLLSQALQGFESPPANALPLHKHSLANVRANLALAQGETERARQAQLPALNTATREPGMRLPLAFGDMLVGMSYLREGNPQKAIAVLQPRLETAERDVGRRSVVASMLAPPLAAAHWLHDEPERSLELLADRLDVIERIAMPDPIILAYRTLSGIAFERGEEARALEYLAALRDQGVARNVPRIVLSSLADQVQIHAVRGRIQAATDLLQEIDAMAGTFEQPLYRDLRRHYRRTAALARAYTCLARKDFDGAETALRPAADAPASARHSAMTLVARALLALVARERGRPEARGMLAEVLSLAKLAGIQKHVESAHPWLAEMLSTTAAADRTGEAAARAASPRGHAAGSPEAPLPALTTSTGGLLTPKEARILALLAVGRANKEIARAMDIGEQTVKWHLKNVFFKLNAASRKHAVDRARLLGLLDG